jgi:uncharacterized repeat protein (TIGR01451 family)
MRCILAVVAFAALSLSVGTAQAQTVTEYSSGITANSGPAEIASGPDSNLWFTEYAGQRIGQITPTGVVTEYTLSAGAFPGGIAAGPDSNLWFTEYGANKIGRITTAGAVTEFAVPTASAGPYGITAGPDGNLWFTESNIDRIGRFNPNTSVFTEFGGITAGATPMGISAGMDGNLWFTERSANKIGRITTTGAVSEFAAGITALAAPEGITAGPDGSLWFTENNGNRIGRITLLGAVTEFSTGITPASSPQGITLGPDGKIWFTEYAGNRIAKISVGADLTIGKTHAGNFALGQTGAQYTITVSNVGTSETNGTTVSVTDTLPVGLSATALSGTGWACVLGTLTCTRADVLAAGASYPLITLTVDVAANAPASVTNTVFVSGGGDVNGANNIGNDPTTVSSPTATPTATPTASAAPIPATGRGGLLVLLALLAISGFLILRTK